LITEWKVGSIILGTYLVVMIMYWLLIKSNIERKIVVISRLTIIFTLTFAASEVLTTGYLHRVLYPSIIVGIAFPIYLIVLLRKKS